jgi:hypothetical protein
VLFHSAQARMPFEYYAGRLPGHAALRVIFPAEDAGGAPTYRDFIANAKNLPLNPLPAQYRRVWVVLAHNRLPDGQPDATTRGLENFLQKHYGAPAVRQYPGIDLLLYGSGGRRGEAGGQRPEPH